MCFIFELAGVTRSKFHAQYKSPYNERKLFFKYDCFIGKRILVSLKIHCKNTNGISKNQAVLLGEYGILKSVVGKIENSCENSIF